LVAAAVKPKKLRRYLATDTHFDMPQELVGPDKELVFITGTDPKDAINRHFKGQMKAWHFAADPSKNSLVQVPIVEITVQEDYYKGRHFISINGPKYKVKYSQDLTEPYYQEYEPGWEFFLVDVTVG
jgi:hypothetical protein